VSIATTVPSAPRNVVANPQISGFNDGSATVTWDAPTNSGGGAITGYVVTTSPVDGTCVTQFARTCVLTGLDPYALYTVRVVATNSVGSSVAGTSSEVSACGFDTRLTRCKWKVAGQDARAEQVDGGVRVSWRYGSASTGNSYRNPPEEGPETYRNGYRRGQDDGNRHLSFNPGRHKGNYPKRYENSFVEGYEKGYNDAKSHWRRR
jgi:hypothetical protein